MSMDNNTLKQFLEQREKLKNNNSNNNNGNGIRWYSLPRKGEAKVRFLPPTHGLDVPGKLVVSHNNLPGDKKKVLCLAHYGKECELCKVVDEYSSRISTADYERYARAYMNVIVLEDKFSKDPIEYGKPYIMSGTDYNLFWLIEQIMNPDIGDVTDTKTGSPVTFKRKTDGGAFDRIVGRAQVPLASTDDAVKVLLEESYDLNKVFKDPDDSTLADVVKAAEELRLMLEERIETRRLNDAQTGQSGMGTTDSKPAETKVETKVDTSTAKDTSTTTTAAAASTTSTVTVPGKPGGAPACFATEHDPSLDKCLCCPFEIECESAKKAKG